MANPEIKKLDGVWTEADVNGLVSWLQSAAGIKELESTQDKILSEAKTFEKMAIVDVHELKAPFTYSI